MKTESQTSFSLQETLHVPISHSIYLNSHKEAIKQVVWEYSLTPKFLYYRHNGTFSIS